MKNLGKVIITAFSGLLLMISMACNNSKAASFQEIDLKRNEQLKERVFEQILSDEELFSDFTGKMRENSQAMQWMRENRPMMQNFYGGKQMQDMIRRNPEMRQNMMQNMMQLMERDTTFMPRNPEMRQQMMQNMLRMMERDTTRMNPEMREQMLENMRRMMARDTVMQNRMHQMMQGNNMMRNN
ncbi:MAG: hypothetical protein ACQEWG_16265 [Bacteroidota bacterium]